MLHRSRLTDTADPIGSLTISFLRFSAQRISFQVFINDDSISADAPRNSMRRLKTEVCYCWTQKKTSVIKGQQECVLEAGRPHPWLWFYEIIILVSLPTIKRWNYDASMHLVVNFILVMLRCLKFHSRVAQLVYWISTSELFGVKFPFSLLSCNLPSFFRASCKWGNLRE